MFTQRCRVPKAKACGLGGGGRGCRRYREDKWSTNRGGSARQMVKQVGMGPVGRADGEILSQIGRKIRILSLVVSLL